MMIAWLDLLQKERLYLQELQGLSKAIFFTRRYRVVIMGIERRVFLLRLFFQHLIIWACNNKTQKQGREPSLFLQVN